MDLTTLKNSILEDNIVDAKEVAIIRETLYADGVIDREEADFLFEINDAVTGNANDPAWPTFFVNALTKHVLADEVSPGEMDDDETNWIIEKIGADGQVDETELLLLVNITKKATSCTDAFNAYVLAALHNAIVDDGVVDDNEVQMIKDVIYGTGGGGGADVDRDEAEFLFGINDAVTDNEGNVAGWTRLFVEALTQHVLADEVSPDELDDDETSWLIDKIGADGKVDDAELALLVNITENAKTCTDTFNAYVLTAIYNAVIEDSIIDDDEVNMIKRVIYGTGGGAGEAVDENEAEFLFKLNDACSGNANAASWRDMFVQAIGSFVLEDETSPGEIDEDEAKWLIDHILEDGQVDDVEKALLAHIKTSATSIHPSLETKLGELGL